MKVLVIGLDNSGKSTIINQVRQFAPALTAARSHGCSATHRRRHCNHCSRLTRSQLKPKKTAVTEATPTVGMSIEAFSKV